MPINPSNRKLYPADWPAIRAAILERAGHRCEQCRKPNRSPVYILNDGMWFDGVMGWWIDERGERILGFGWDDIEQERIVDVVLTVHHVDFNPANNAPENLLALCQRCHLRLDAPLHKAHARAARRGKLAAHDLFDGSDHGLLPDTEPA